MKAILKTIETDKKGSDPKHNSNIGRISTMIEGKSCGSISIDAFEGQGETYKRREDADIVIYYGGKKEFSGTLTELIELLKN